MKLKNIFKNRALRKGTYSVGMIFVVLAIVIILNLLVRELPATVTKFDFSVNKMYTLTDTTVDYLKNLEEDVEIYLLAGTGSEDNDLYQMLEKYAALSSHIKLEQIDPTLHPNFVSEYTSELVSTNSIVVASAKRSRVIDYSNVTTQVINWDTYQYETAFDGEGLVTSAINYVVTDNLPVMYLTEGHNEEALSTSFESMVMKANVELKSVNLLETEEVPEDCDILFVYSPSVDFTAEEAQKIINYIDKGGSMTIVSGDTGTKLVNLGIVLEYYGMELEQGVVVETNSKYYLNSNTGLKPAKAAHSIMNSLITKGTSVLLPNAQGISVRADARSSITFTKLLTTSSDSFLRTGSSLSLSIQEDDIAGPITVGIAAEEKHDGITSKVVVFGSGYLVNDSVNQMVSGGNYDMLVNALTWMATIDDNISIPAKSMSLQYLSLTQADFYRWMWILVAIIPVAFIGTGFVVWFTRRRK